MTAGPTITCHNCGQVIVKEKDDPWFHDDTGEERCWEDADEFATPTPIMVGFSPNEHGILPGLIRDAIRKAERNRVSMVKKFGDEARHEALDERIAILESIYQKLGGDPARITNRTFPKEEA